MTFVLCVTVGVLCAVATYLLLGRSLKDVCIGVFLFSHAVNLCLVTVAGSPVGKMPPVLGDGHALEKLADPLPQALVLTAVVIGFAVQAFLLTLMIATYRKAGSLEIDELATMHDTRNTPKEQPAT